MRRAAAFLAVFCSVAPAFAADHRDGPATTADPASDINDVFAWMSADGAKVYLVMTVFPAATSAAKFSDKTLYVFHTSSQSAIGMAQTATNIICKFDTAQKIQCWAGDEYLTGDASSVAGIASASGKLKVFAGLRDDPFFFNLDGFRKTAKTVHDAAPALLTAMAFDANFCPKLGAPTATELQRQLKEDPNGAPGTAAKNFFAGLNTLSIVVAVDKALVTKGGPVMSVWASTNKAQ
jgi:hypothetical protein